MRYLMLTPWMIFILMPDGRWKNNGTVIGHLHGTVAATINIGSVMRGIPAFGLDRVVRMMVVPRRSQMIVSSGVFLRQSRRINIPRWLWFELRSRSAKRIRESLLEQLHLVMVHAWAASECRDLSRIWKFDHILGPIMSRIF
jgi:hypothetical protein